jgi:hypothetical protein
MFNGGIVSEAIKYPRGKGRLAVRAILTGININSNLNTKTIIRQIKGDLFVGTWNVVGIEGHSKVPREIIVVVEADEASQTINPGDILILGRGAVSKYATNLIEPKPHSLQAVIVGSDELRGLLFPDPLFGTALLVFHNPADDIMARDLSLIRTSTNTYITEFLYISTCIARYTLEFKLSGKAVAARSIIELLSPIRRFVLDASEEICLDIPRKKGRRAEEESELFEPLIIAKAASVRFRVHPSSSSRTQDLNTSKPLRLLNEIIHKANAGDGRGVLKALQENLKSVAESLKLVEDIVKTAKKHKLEFSSTDAPVPIALGNKALSAIRSAKAQEIRSKKVQGDIYAVDLHRRWCRVSTSDTDPPEDWKLDFTEDLEEKVEGKYPRRVNVEFETFARPGIISGKGRLLSIQDTTQQDPNPSE